MNPEDTAILHPGSYGFRSNVAQLVSRAVAASDATQRAWIAAHLAAVKVAVLAGSTIQRNEYAQDTLGHGGRHLNWLSTDVLNRSLDEADVATDVANVCDAAILLL